MNLSIQYSLFYKKIKKIKRKKINGLKQVFFFQAEWIIGEPKFFLSHIRLIFFYFFQNSTRLRLQINPLGGI